MTKNELKTLILNIAYDIQPMINYVDIIQSTSNDSFKIVLYLRKFDSIILKEYILDKKQGYYSVTDVYGCFYFAQSYNLKECLTDFIGGVL